MKYRYDPMKLASFEADLEDVYIADNDELLSLNSLNLEGNLSENDDEENVDSSHSIN